MLRPLEILGAVAAFIPGVSTITSAIKAYVYYNRSKTDLEALQKTDQTAQKISNITGDKLIFAKSYIYHDENELWKSSLVEMIPGVNIIAAVVSAIFLADLNKARDAEDNPTLYLGEKYGLTHKEINNQSLLEALTIIENSELLWDVDKPKRTRHDFPRDGATGATSYAFSSELINKCKNLSLNNPEMSGASIIKYIIQERINDLQTTIPNIESKYQKKLDTLDVRTKIDGFNFQPDKVLDKKIKQLSSDVETAQSKLKTYQNIFNKIQ